MPGPGNPAKLRPFTKGDPRNKGRPKGAKSYTTNMREAVLDAFNKIGGVEEFAKWAKTQKGKAAFYQIAARLIPTEITGKDGKDLTPPAVHVHFAGNGADTTTKAPDNGRDPEQPSVH